MNDIIFSRFFNALTELHNQNDIESILNYSCGLFMEFTKINGVIIVFFPKRSDGLQVNPIFIGNVSGDKFDIDIFLKKFTKWDQLAIFNDMENDKSPFFSWAKKNRLKSFGYVVFSGAERILPQIDKLYHNVTQVSACLVSKRNSKMFSQETSSFINAIQQQAMIALSGLAHRKRSQQLDLFVNGALSATSLLGHDYLIKEIIEQAVIILDAKRGGFHRYIEEEGKLEFVAGYKRSSYSMKVGEGIAGNLVASGKDYIIVDNYYSSEWKHKVYDFEERDCPSVLKVLLKHENRVIGVLYVDSDINRHFSEQDALMLLQLGDFIIAELIRSELPRNNITNRNLGVDNAEYKQLNSEVLAFTRIIRRIVEYRTSIRQIASSVTQNIVLMDNLPRTLKDVIEFCKQLANCDIVTLYVRDLSTNRLMNPPLHTKVTFPTKMQNYGPVRDRSNLDYVATQNDLYIVEKLSFDNLFGNAQFTQDEGVRSYIAAPLNIPQIGNVGVMFLHYRTPRLFSVDEKDNVRFLAAQAAVTVRVSQILDMYQDRARILAKLNEIGKHVTSTDEVAQILRQIIEGAAHLTSRFQENVNGVIHEITKNDENYIIKSVPYPPNSDQVEPRLPPNETGVTWDVISSGNYRYFTDITDETIKVNPKVRQKNIRAMIAIPIKFENEVHGAFFINYLYRRSFDNFTISVLEQLAGYAAIAIRNARQLDFERRSNQVLKSLSDATEAITNAGLPEKQRLKRILDGALNMIGNPNQCVAYVHLLNRQNPYLLELTLSQSVSSELLDQSINLSDSINLEPYVGNGVNELGDAKIGLVGLTVLLGVPTVVNKNLRGHPNYRNQINSTNSQISVPLIVDEPFKDTNETSRTTTIGVLTLEHPNENVFTTEIKDRLCALARVAAGTIRDSRQHQDLLSVEARQNQFLSVVKHELGNHIFEKDWATDTLLEDSSLSSEQKSIIEVIDSELEVEKFLVNNLLDFGRIQEGKIQPDYALVDLSNLINSAIKFAKSTLVFTHNSFSVYVNLPQNDKLMTVTDSAMIVQILHNLVHNAIKFTASKIVTGQIRVSAFRDGQDIVIAIEDNGPGLPQDILKMIKDGEFNSIAILPRVANSGMRIGLSIVNMFLNALKINLNVESDISTGTKFWFSMPAIYSDRTS